MMLNGKTSPNMLCYPQAEELQTVLGLPLSTTAAAFSRALTNRRPILRL